MWVAASALMACYRIDPSCSQAAAKELLGEDFGSFIITDRYAGYHWADVLQQQLCWCHAIRQFVSLSERDGAPGRLGHELLAAARQVIAAHREYLQNGHELTWLEAQLRPSREQIETLLQRGVRGRHLKTRRFCAGLLDEYDALWTFCEVPGIDPTNNAAERALRHGVLTQKDPARHPIAERKPLDRTDLHRPRDPHARPRLGGGTNRLPRCQCAVRSVAASGRPRAVETGSRANPSASTAALVPSFLGRARSARALRAHRRGPPRRRCISTPCASACSARRRYPRRPRRVPVCGGDRARRLRSAAEPALRRGRPAGDRPAR